MNMETPSTAVDGRQDRKDGGFSVQKVLFFLEGKMGPTTLPFPRQ